MNKVRHCPTCGEVPVYYNEHFIIVSEWDADQEGFATENGATGCKASPQCVYAVCKNGHEWKLRGVTSITQMRREPDGRKGE